MKSTLTFDTLEYTTVLKESGINQMQAEAITKATTKALHQMLEIKELATKHDIQQLELKLLGFIIKSTTTAITIIGGLQTVFHFLG